MNKINDILIVVDMQNDFVTGSLKNKNAEKIIGKIVEKVKQHKGPVVFTRDTHDENYLNTNEGKSLPVPHCIKDSEGWEIVKPLNDLIASKDIKSNVVKIVNKPNFGYIDWTKGLENVNSIELCGTVTSICVVSNALILKAIYPHVDIIVDENLVADLSEEGQQAALKVMENCQITVKKQESTITTKPHEEDIESEHA